MTIYKGIKNVHQVINIHYKVGRGKYDHEETEKRGKLKIKLLYIFKQDLRIKVNA